MKKEVSWQAIWSMAIQWSEIMEPITKYHECQGRTSWISWLHAIGECHGPTKLCRVYMQVWDRRLASKFHSFMISTNHQSQRIDLRFSGKQRRSEYIATYIWWSIRKCIESLIEINPSPIQLGGHIKRSTEVSLEVATLRTSCRPSFAHFKKQWSSSTPTSKDLLGFNFP